ncbi:MAG: hypothetical protein ACODAG_10415 [Myxococcota bacterium]
MLIVMLIILMTTATAYFAIHATSFEIRASGHMRQAMQTQYVAETGAMATLGWIDQQDPRQLQMLVRRGSEANRAAGGQALNLEPFGEPELALGKDGHRLNMQQLGTDLGGLPIDGESLGGPRQAYEPQAYVDVLDLMHWTGVTAGERSDGRGSMRYMRATYTSRGRTRIDADYTTPGDRRPFHEGASDARAQGVSGPYMMSNGGGG